MYRQVGKIDGHCEKINYSVMNTLLDIDKARRCTASAVRYKNLREGYSGMQNKKNLLIYDLGKIILAKACDFVNLLKEEGYDDQLIAINISLIQLLREDFTKDVHRILLKKGVSGKNLEFEITESILMDNFELINEKLAEVKRLGVSVALDDFGTGYSSLNCLTYLPVNKIKLDKSICDQFLQGNRIKVIESLILLAHSLNLKIMAEGIEAWWDKVAILKNSGCDGIQGYVFSKPLEPTEIAAIYNHNLLTKAPQ